MLYLYAVLEAGPRAAGRAGGGRARAVGGDGMDGEPLALVREGAVLAVAGVVDRAPGASTAALRGHDEVVRRLAESARAILPARFGTVLEDESALRRTLALRQVDLRDALRAVAGCAQMTLRVFGPPVGAGVAASPALRAARPPAAPATGTGYLLARAHARHREGAPDVVARLHALLEPFVHGERTERHARPPLVASVHHLVLRHQVAAYRRALAGAADDLRPWRLTATGPWAPYAFAPEAVA